LGIGDWAQSPIPNPQSPIPNPHMKNMKNNKINNYKELNLFQKLKKLIKMNNFNYRINHAKKNSCVLLNKIPMNNTLKDTFYDKSYNIIYNKNSENNLTSRLNTSINSKNSIKIKKMSFFSRPYIKQLSQYCFLTFKNKNNHKISEITVDKKNDKVKIPEKDDKTNIYFNLIKTYYDENGTKLKPKKTKVNPIDTENDYPKIIKTKKKKKNNSLDEKENENFLNFEKKK
jgi:hypothetical protein